MAVISGARPACLFECQPRPRPFVPMGVGVRLRPLHI